MLYVVQKIPWSISFTKSFLDYQVKPKLYDRMQESSLVVLLFADGLIQFLGWWLGIRHQKMIIWRIHLSGVPHFLALNLVTANLKWELDQFSAWTILHFSQMTC